MPGFAVADVGSKRQLRPPVLGWITDFLRSAWGLFYWNLRKSAYRASKRRGRCPCQNPSDSGKAGETMCEAALHYNQPRRFRAVCPLLKLNDRDQLRCSVDAPDVKSYWWRFFAFYSFLVVGAYASVVLGVFGFMRQVGYPVSIKQIALPSGWQEIDKVRSEFFLQKAQTAYSIGDVNEAVLSLSLAYDFDPANYDAGLLLATLWQTGRPDVSNHLYRRLLTEHPDRRPQTAQAWLRALLPRGDFETIEVLALQALRYDPSFAPAWIHAFLYSNERTRNAEMLARALDTPEALPPGVAQILQLEAEVRARPIEIARTRLAERPPNATPTFVAYYQVRRLIELDDVARGLELLGIVGSQLSDRDRIHLQLQAYARSGYRRLHVNLFEQILSLPVSPVQIELLSAHLIEHPDAELYERFVGRVDPMKLTEPTQQQAALMSMFCAAGVHRDEARLEHYANILRQITGSEYAALSLAARMFLDPANMRFDSIFSALQPLSLDLTYSLLERFVPREP